MTAKTESVEIGGQQVEVKWFWRRVLTFAVMAVCMGFVGWIIWRTSDPVTLKWLGLALIGFALIAHLTYLTGAGLSDWARLAAASASNVGGLVSGLIPGKKALDRALEATVPDPNK